MVARAIYDAVKVDGIAPPYDTIHLKVYYPAAPDDSMAQKNMGMVPPRQDSEPWPVLIMMPGTNVPTESYSWLATALAEKGIVTVLYSWIKEDMPGFICLSPGIDLANLRPDNYGAAPTANAIAPIYKSLAKLNQHGLLKNHLDMNAIILGGHSAGGSVALLNNNPNWFPWLRGAFSYAAHSAASTQLGFADDSMLELCSELPYLLLAGSRDGVIAASSFRYGDKSDSGSSDRIERSFKESISSARGDTHLVKIAGANHFSFTHPTDSATGRQFLDWEEEGSAEDIRSCCAELISSFIKGQVLKNPAQLAHFQQLISDKYKNLIADHQQK